MRNPILFACILCLASASVAPAQSPPPGSSWDRTSIEEGFLNGFSLTRQNLGPRSIGMGRTGLALTGSVEYHSLNPAAILGVESIQVFSQGAFLSGSAKTDYFPTYTEEVDTDWSDFSTAPGTKFGYSGVSLGIPVVLLGARGAFGATYARHRYTALPSENRQEALGALTENTPSTVGIRNRPDGGYDVFTLTAARRVMDKVDVGVNMNYENGWIRHESSVDVSVFGRPAAAESRRFDQDFSSLHYDVGARGDFGPFSLGLSYFFGHHIEYENGRTVRTPLYIIGDQDPFTLRSSVVDHRLSLPARLGLGGAYRVGDRLTVAVDFWKQDWSNASFLRDSLDVFMQFEDPTDSTSQFFHYLTPVEGTEVRVNTRMADTQSLRLGLEYYVLENENLRIPLRLGWHSGVLTRSQVDVAVSDSLYIDYLSTLEAYRKDIADGTVDDPETEAQLKDFLEHGSFVHRSPKEYTTSTVTLGMGIEVDELTVDASLDITSYDTESYFNSTFSPQWWPFIYGTEGSETITTFSVSARIAF